MTTSIIIPNYNGRKLLEKNLPEVIKSAPESEIIIVDDASTDDSVAFLSKNFPQVKIIEQKQNKRFAAACNAGAKAATGEIIVLLNSDVIPDKDFLSPLINHFRDEKVFSVSSKEIDSKGNVSGRTEGEFRRGFLVHWRPEDQQSLTTLWNIGGSVAIDKQKFLQLGGFDEIYSPAYWEDIDLCWRAKKKGWKVFFEKKSIIHHNHETTNQTVFGTKKLEIMSFRNSILFVWKNYKGMQLLQHFLWLPYHLIFTSYRSNGAFLVGFVQAVRRWISYK